MNKILIVISISLVLCKTSIYTQQLPSKIQPQPISIQELIEIKANNTARNHRHIVIIDVDAPQTYNNEHIDGAINIGKKTKELTAHRWSQPQQRDFASLKKMPRTES